MALAGTNAYGRPAMSDSGNSDGGVSVTLRLDQEQVDRLADAVVQSLARMPRTQARAPVQAKAPGHANRPLLIALLSAVGLLTLLILVLGPGTAPPTVVVPEVARAATPLRTVTVLEERFDGPPRPWPNDELSTAWFADGAYRLFARRPSQFVAITAPLAEPLRDVVVHGTFRKVGGPPGGGYGLIVRDQGPGPRDGVNQTGRYYVLEVGDRGELGIWRRDVDHWIDLVPWTRSNAVRPGGATNEVTARAIGQQLTLLVNGVLVASQIDATLPDGAVGVFVGGDFNEVVMERFVVQVPN
jgi:hypothetical protein